MSATEEQEEQIAELAQITEELEQYQLYNKLELYKPYPKQQDFHNSGSAYRERMLIAANQVGKTWCAGAEVAMHMTGRYPDWWEGYKFNKATKWWVAGVTGESTRDNPQRVLLGQKRNYGTGMVPLDSIEAVQLARGTPDLVDNFTVRHETGGLSYCWLKSYEKGREKWQGETLDGEWYDEEPPIDIYTEGLTRLNVSQGPVLITFTPLLGMSEVVRRFLQPPENR
jgi:phage terminase large subunit-like protein